MLSMVKCLWYAKDRYLSQKAQGMVEYALIIAFVVVLAAVLMSNGGLSQSIQNIFGDANTQLTNAHTNAQNAAAGGGGNE